MSSTRIEDAFSPATMSSFSSSTSTAVTDLSTIENSYSSSASFATPNPFNDATDFGSSSESDSQGSGQTLDQSAHVRPEIKAFTTNLSNLDGILSHFSGSLDDLKSSPASLAATKNPFHAQRARSPALNELKGMEFPKSPLSSSPFSMKPASDGNNINYDALRETIEHDKMHSNVPAFSENANQIKVPTVKVCESGNGNGKTLDFFKDAAVAAFSEFGSIGAGGRKHEFFNKFPDAFGGNDGLNAGINANHISSA